LEDVEIPIGSWRPPNRSEEVASRIRKVIKIVPPETVALTADYDMNALPRIIARITLRSLADGAAIVRKELGAN
jgi:methionine synthase II (cobalamin-independent)